MGFIQACRININTQDIKNKLLEYGYENDWYHLLKCNGIGTKIDEKGKGKFYGILDEMDFHESQYDCNNNIDLFLSLTALKDNSHLNQWLICTIEHLDTDNNVNYNVGDWRLGDRKIMKKYKKQEVWRKATPQEIIEHYGKL